MSIFYKYYHFGTIRQCKITGTVYTKDYKGDWFKCSKETQKIFNNTNIKNR